jgi:hypothetical protein
MLVAFLVGGVPGMAAFFALATIAGLLAYFVGRRWSRE